jgi:hypothetical protein
MGAFGLLRDVGWRDCKRGRVPERSPAEPVGFQYAIAPGASTPEQHPIVRPKTAGRAGLRREERKA